MSFCCVPRCNSVFELKNSFFKFLFLFHSFVKSDCDAGSNSRKNKAKTEVEKHFRFLLLSLIIYINQFHPKTTVFCFPADLISSATNKKYCRKHFDTVLTSLLWLCSGKVARDAERQSGLSPCRTDSHL